MYDREDYGATLSVIPFALSSGVRIVTCARSSVRVRIRLPFMFPPATFALSFYSLCSRSCSVHSFFLHFLAHLPFVSPSDLSETRSGLHVLFSLLPPSPFLCFSVERVALVIYSCSSLSGSTHDSHESYSFRSGSMV